MAQYLGKYLYCIVRCSEERPFEDVAPIGGALGPVSTVCQNGLAVAVSDSLVTELDSTRANMLAHERVVESVMREYTVLPVRFGTVADPGSPTEQVRRLLAKRHQEFDGLLAEMEGKVELGLKALWREEKALFEEIVAQNNAIRRLRDSLKGRSPEATHFDRIRLGEMVKAAMDRKRAAEAERLLAPLRRIAHRVIENRTVVDRMITNAAFLVDKAHEEEFDLAVSKLDSEMGDRLSFKYVGPVPPYNFVNITVNWQEL